MQLARFLVEAVVLGKQSPNRLVREHPISRSWFYELLARYRRDGPAALEPRPHRPTSCPHQVDQALVDAILELRAQLSAAGLASGAPTRRGGAPLESEPARLGVQCVHSTPYRPQTCGKVERFHQPLKLFLANQAPAESIAHLQLQLDTFRTIYNQQRPHRALDGR